jgi:hypothetical protein
MTESVFDNGYPVGRLTPTVLTACGVTPTGVTGLTVAHKQMGPVIQTTITLAATPQTVVNGTEYQGTKLWTFPSGLLVLFDTEISLTQTTTSALATTLNASSTGALALGTATASAVALTSTMADLLPSTAFVSSATVSVAGTTVTGNLDANKDLAEMLTLDGTATAKPVYLNSAFATTTDVDGDATITWTGTIKLKWLYYSGSQAV